MNYLLVLILGLIWGFLAYRVSEFYATNLEQHWKSGQLKLHRMLITIISELRKNKSHFKPKPQMFFYALLSAVVVTGFYHLIVFHNWPSLLILLPLMLILLSVIDIRSKLLPNQFTYPLTVLGLIFNYAFSFVSLKNALLGLIVGFLLPYLLNRLYVVVRKKTGMGLGDAKLYAAIGAWLGVYYLLTIFIIASIINLITILTIAMRGQFKLDSYLAYGPTISIATLLSLTLIPLI
jgi:prepilin signal peptidase PulO-like enzyme (type II secretory pathway)